MLALVPVLCALHDDVHCNNDSCPVCVHAHDTVWVPDALPAPERLIVQVVEPARFDIPLTDFAAAFHGRGPPL